MCSLTMECVLLLWNVSSYYGMCPLTMECVLLLWNVFSYYGMRSLAVSSTKAAVLKVQVPTSPTAVQVPKMAPKHHRVQVPKMESLLMMKQRV